MDSFSGALKDFGFAVMLAAYDCPDGEPAPSRVVKGSSGKRVTRRGTLVWASLLMLLPRLAFVFVVSVAAIEPNIFELHQDGSRLPRDTSMMCVYEQKRYTWFHPSIHTTSKP